MNSCAQTEWDRPAILAEIRRRDSTLGQIAEEAGLAAATLSWALKNPRPRANRVIADFLGVSMHELWPHWFDRDDKLISTRPLKSPRRERITRGSGAARASASRRVAA